MSTQKIKDFLKTGAFLQIGPDRFKLLLAPFTVVDWQNFCKNPLKSGFWKPHFWDFLEKSSESYFRQNSVYEASEELELTRAEFLKLIESEVAEEPRVQWEPAKTGDFRDQFIWSQSRFSNSALQKTVPTIAQKSNYRISIPEKIYLLRKLLLVDSYGWSYGYFSESENFLGHSPEVIGRWMYESKRFCTMALAGTLPASDENLKNIIADSKIQNEHRLVVDDMIQKINASDLEVSVTEPRVLKHLVHLQTKMSVKVDSLHAAMNLLRELHPTAALGIYPREKNAAVEFSKFAIQKERKSFAAPFAFISQSEVHCIAAIRNLMFENEKVEIFSGCGVTSDSQLDSELGELELKRNSVKKYLGIYAD